MAKEYDLHCHTTVSDGKASLAELVEIAKIKKLKGFAVTDHDALDASKEALYLKEKSSIDIISGVELSAKISGCLIDIMGYFVNPWNKELEEVCKINQDFRRGSAGANIQKINDKYHINPPITYDEVCSKKGSVTKNDINAALIRRGRFKEREAFETCLNKNSPEYCCVERDAVEIDKAMNAIVKSGGVVGLPHPALIACDYPRLKNEGVLGMLKKYLNSPIKIIETDYPYQKARRECNVSPYEEFWEKIADDYGLIGVGGSDGHQESGRPELGERTTRSSLVKKIRNLSRKEQD